MSETVTVEQILREVHPEISPDDNNYRDRLSETDIAYYKRVNNFVEGDKLVVVQNSEIVYIED